MALIEVIDHVKLPRDFLEMLFENLGKHPEKLLEPVDVHFNRMTVAAREMRAV